MKKKNSSKTPTSTIKYSKRQLDDALFMLDEAFERVGVEFVLIGQTLKEVIEDGELKSAITVAVKETENTQSLRTVFEVNMKPMGKNQWEVNGVPVTIKWVSRSDLQLSNPDITFYDHNNYNIPNRSLRKRYA